ncbi:unnamed protein product, partial [Ranitomeya imitator]
MDVKHKEFEKAGEKAGLQIWRIEKVEAGGGPQGAVWKLLCRRCLSGAQHSGDGAVQNLQSALLARQDESTAAAIFTVQMDDHLGGKAVQYRELHNCESNAFLGYFKTGIKYQ